MPTTAKIISFFRVQGLAAEITFTGARQAIARLFALLDRTNTPPKGRRAGAAMREVVSLLSEDEVARALEIIRGQIPHYRQEILDARILSKREAPERRLKLLEAFEERLEEESASRKPKMKVASVEESGGRFA